MVFRQIFFLMTTATCLLLAPAGRAQCLPLELLDQGIAAGRTTPDSLRAVFSLPEMVFETWVEHPGKEPYWTHAATNSAPADGASEDGWVGLRRSNEWPYYDLVYKTTSHECLAQLRAELRRRGKLKSEIINCVQCEGERLLGKNYTVTIFTQKKAYAAKTTAFPYVLVVRRDGSKAVTPNEPLPSVANKP